MDESRSDREPQPWSSAWSTTPAAARWRAAQAAPEAHYAGALVEREEYPTFLTTLKAPPDDAAPAIDAGAAWLSARELARWPRRGGGPTIYLASADIRGSLDTLVYVLRWENVRWAPSGRPVAVGTRPSSGVTGSCIVLIDATTGASLGSMYFSREPEPRA